MDTSGVYFPVHSWSEAVVTATTSLLSGIVAIIPNIIGAIVIIILGWFLALLARNIFKVILRAIQFNTIADRVGLNSFLLNAGVKRGPMDTMAEIIRWFVFICFVLAGMSVLGIPAVSTVLANIINYIPKVIAAVFILAGGLILANFVSEVLRGTLRSMRISGAGMLATIAKWILVIFTGLAVIRQLDIVPDLINILFIGIVGAVSLAIGLMFGLGGKDVAAQIISEWYKSGQQMQRNLPQGNPQNRPRR